MICSLDNTKEDQG